jgi:hypothetical protein
MEKTNVSSTNIPTLIALTRRVASNFLEQFIYLDNLKASGRLCLEVQRIAQSPTAWPAPFKVAKCL